MLSRVANSLYWMGRYMERGENIARFVDVNMHLLLDVPVYFEQQWMPLVNITGDDDAFRERYDEASQANVMQFLTFDQANPNAILSTLYAARENARSIREVISLEMWEQINRTYLMVKDAETSGRINDDAASFYSHFKKACHLFIGTTDATMTHGEGWHFARLGRLIERADKTSRILDVKYFMLLPHVDYVGTPYDSLQWTALLKSTSAFEMYRKRFRRITPRQVTAFLILDREFPRAIQYCLTKAEESLHVITDRPSDTFGNRAEQRLGRLGAELDYMDVDEIFTEGLHEYLDGLQAKLNDVGTAIHETFFALDPIATTMTQRMVQS